MDEAVATGEIPFGLRCIREYEGNEIFLSSEKSKDVSEWAQRFSGFLYLFNFFFICFFQYNGLFSYILYFLIFFCFLGC